LWEQHPEKVKDELRIFVGEMTDFKMLEDYLPKQKGKFIELREHQQAALSFTIQKIKVYYVYYIKSVCYRVQSIVYIEKEGCKNNFRSP